MLFGDTKYLFCWALSTESKWIGSREGGGGWVKGRAGRDGGKEAWNGGRRKGRERMVEFPRTSFHLELETGCWNSPGWVKAFCWSSHPSPPWMPDSPAPLYKPGLLEAPLLRENDQPPDTVAAFQKSLKLEVSTFFILLCNLDFSYSQFHLKMISEE